MTVLTTALMCRLFSFYEKYRVRRFVFSYVIAAAAVDVNYRPNTDGVVVIVVVFNYTNKKKSVCDGIIF